MDLTTIQTAHSWPRSQNSEPLLWPVKSGEVHAPEAPNRGLGGGC